MMDFTQIRSEKKKRGCTVREMIALAPNNDPFYAGAMPAQVRDAEWFAGVWNQ